jgi:hypothetical protein
MAFNVKDAPFNAIGDGSGVDDTAAIQAALDAAAANGRGGKVIIPDGIYFTSAPLNINGIGITFEGEGAGDKASPFGDSVLGPTTIIGTHTFGPVLRVWNRHCAVLGMRLDADEARQAAAFNVQSSGLRIEANDDAAGRCDGTYIDDVYAVDQPGDAILFGGGTVVGSVLSRSGGTDCKGHGIVVDGGDRTGRLNKINPGIMEIVQCRVHRVQGNALALGSPSSDAPGVPTMPYRIHIQNFECFHVGDSAAYGDQAVWAFGENLVFDQCAFGGSSVDGTQKQRTGIYIAGRTIRLNACRYIGTERIATVGQRTNLGTRDVIFDGVNVSGPAPALNPAIVVTTGAKGVKVRSFAQNDVASWVTGVADLDIIT